MRMYDKVNFEHSVYTILSNQVWGIYNDEVSQQIPENNSASPYPYSPTMNSQYVCALVEQRQ